MLNQLSIYNLGAIVLSLYYLFLWNPYKGVGRGGKSSTVSDNFTMISTSDLSELITSPTVTTLLNSTAVLISSAALHGTSAGTRNMSALIHSVTPKTLSYKQKRSSERVSDFEEKLKTSFKPFYIPNKLSSKEDILTKNNNIIFVESFSNGKEKRIKQPKILSRNVVGGDKNSMKRKLRTLDLNNVKPKSPSFEMYNLINPQPFYLEDPFTTYAKGISFMNE